MSSDSKTTPEALVARTRLKPSFQPTGWPNTQASPDPSSKPAIGAGSLSRTRRARPPPIPGPQSPLSTVTEAPAMVPLNATPSPAATSSGVLRRLGVLIEVKGLPSAPGATSPSRAATASTPPAGHVRMPCRDPLEIHLQGSLLTVDGQQFSPRAIVYQGEPLAWLKERGFNSVWLEAPPSAALAAEARQHGMLIVGPSPTGLRPGGANARRLPEMTLGVFLPTSRAMAAAEATQVAGQLERAKSTDWRPMITRAATSAPQVCRVTDILLVGRAPLNTSLELADEPACLAAQGLLARPGTPCWAEVQTEPPAAIQRQMELLAHSWLPRVTVEPEQIRLLTYSALAGGARGVVFQSSHRLDGEDPQDRLRAATLTLLNRELAVLSPWIAASAGHTVIETSDPDTRAVLLNMDRAKLLVVLRCPRYAQMVTGEPAAETTSVVVPGVPPSYMIFRVKPTALETLEGQRVTGGTRVVINEPEPVSLVLLSGDSRASSALSRSLAAESRAVAEQEVFLARQMMTLVENVDQQLSAARTPRPPRAEQQLAAARRQLDHGVQLLESNDAGGCLRMIRQSQSTLRRLRWQHWALAAESETTPLSLPFTTHFAMLPYHWSAHENVSSASTGPNLLVGGEMESLEQLMAAGWRHMQPEGETHSVDVRLMAPAHSGQTALRLSAKQPRHAGAGPPLAIVSPAVAFEPGQLVCFRCWVRALPPPEGGASLEIETWPGGAALAERMRVAPEWRELKLYRVIDDDGQARFTFRLLGPGEAWIDEVSIAPVEFSQSALTSDE